MALDNDDILAVQLHDLKNRLGLLCMNLDGIPRLGLPEYDTHLDAVRLLSSQISDRLHQALMLYKLDNQAIRAKIDAHSPDDFINALAATARALTAGRLVVETSLADNVPALWFFDRNLVEMGMLNAIHNSLNYAHTRIRIGAKLVDGFLALMVEDDSPGYPQHILGCVEDGTACHSQGTGLGLLFANLIAQAHDNHGQRGKLTVYNRNGACFGMLLP